MCIHKYQTKKSMFDSFKKETANSNMAITKIALLIFFFFFVILFRHSKTKPKKVCWSTDKPISN